MQLIVEDPEISEVSLKSLSLLVQLFGGEHPDALSQENMVNIFVSDRGICLIVRKQGLILENEGGGLWHYLH